MEMIHPYFLGITKTLTEREEEDPFASRFLNDFGLPIWEEGLIFDPNPNEVLSVFPIVKNEYSFWITIHKQK